MKHACLLKLAGTIFGIVGVLHIIRFVMNWPLEIGTFMLPGIASLVIGIVLVVLSFFYFKTGWGSCSKQ